ncbi:MAG: hydroxypyruvate isomerase family protein [Candidatus Dormibacteraceae bacterium]
MSANLSMLWPELDVYDRFAAASAAGFRLVEMGFPYLLNTKRVERLLAEHDQKMVLFDPPAGDWDAGERGVLAIPGRETDFEKGIRRSLKLARRLGTTMFNCLAGILPKGVTPEQAAETAIGNLRRMAPVAQDAGVVLLVEGINSIDLPGFVVDTVAGSAAMVLLVGHPNVRLQLDVYHMAMAGDDPVAALRAYFSMVAHVQIADMPGRHQPGTGHSQSKSFSPSSIVSGTRASSA